MLRMIYGFVVVAALLTTPVLAKKDLPDLPRDEDGRITYTEVVQVEGVSADELFSRASAWVAHSFISATDVTKLSDREAGRVIVKGGTSVRYYFATQLMMYEIAIEVKDGRYRYRITGFYIRMVNGDKYDDSSKYGRRRFLELIPGIAEDIRVGLAAAMQEESDLGPSDW